MEKIFSTLKRLTNSPHLSQISPIHFVEGSDFHWDHTKRIVYYDPADPDAPALLLHETGHALLNHTVYPNDITLLVMERDAWRQAKELARDLHVSLNEDLVEDALDTYRDWLHARSTCPNCGATGIQESEKIYSCLACHHRWTVNEARVCALRRHDITKQKHP